MKHYLIKIYHSYQKGREWFSQFLDQILETLKWETIIFWLNYRDGNTFFSLSIDQGAYPSFESAFYANFNNFQTLDDTQGIRKYDASKTVVAEMSLENLWFAPAKYEAAELTNMISSLMRTCEWFDFTTDKIWFFVALEPTDTDKLWFQLKSRRDTKVHNRVLATKFYKYMFNRKVESGRKEKSHKYFKEKVKSNVFGVRCFFIAQSSTKALARGKVKALFNNFQIFSNFPYNDWTLQFHDKVAIQDLAKWKIPFTPALLSSQEISSFFYFPDNARNETSLLKAMAVRLSIPTGIPTFDYDVDTKNNEIIPKNVPREATVLGISDYRSIRVPIGIYEEDRLRHMYIVGKSGVGKSKLMQSMIIDDMNAGRGFAMIDPHGDLVSENLMFVPEHRKKDVIIFDPTDEEFPFCLNPLDCAPDESKQVLAKWFIDIFKKFFWAVWNDMLEHVLRMIFLALLDRPGSTLFDIIRALTDKDFRYSMIETINDDVVRNFWTNEFAWWSQQFNTQAIMPILNKVWQLLSIDVLKNIFWSPANKLDFRQAMDEGKIIFIKLSKGKLQEQIMWFLGAMFITKIYQAAMSRQNLQTSDRKPFFLYVDEFQNFTTETFGEILAEARKYGLGLIAAHQYLSQIPQNLSDALFWNTGTLISFRISSEDSLLMQKHFEPMVSAYDIANLNMREYYCKMIVKWQVKDAFSVRTCYTPDAPIDKNKIHELYEISRAKYNRTLVEAKQEVVETQKDVMSAIEEFAEPMI
jgi:hypothetical protein